MAHPVPTPQERPVLVIEHDPVFRRAVAAVLGEEGYGVVTVQDAREALAWLAGGGRPALVLLDVLLPAEAQQAVDARLKADAALAPVTTLLIAATTAPLEQSTGGTLSLREVERLLQLVRQHCPL